MENIIDKQATDMIDFLERLVNIDSGTYDKEGVDDIAKILVEQYMAIGFNGEVFPNKELGNNHRLIHKDATHPKILIVAHLDTVFPKGTAKERPFKIVGDRAYGPGVIDMKASHVQVYYAMRTLLDSGSDAYKNV